MVRVEWWPHVAELTSTQEGLVTAAQMRLLGVSGAQVQRLVGAGLLEPVRRGVYSAPSAPDDHRWRELRASWLLLDPERSGPQRCADDNPRGVVSHASAALLWDIGALEADVFEYTCWGARLRTSQKWVTVHRSDLAQNEWSVRHGLAVTTPERTIADLAGMIDGDHLERMVLDALIARHATPDALSRALDAAAPEHGYEHGQQWLAAITADLQPDALSTYLTQARAA